jgi:hypothetical protein
MDLCHMTRQEIEALLKMLAEMGARGTGIADAGAARG